MRRILFSTLCAALAAAVLTACGSSGASADHKADGAGRINGALFAVGGPAPDKARPVDGEISIRDGDTVVATVRAVGGSFSANVPPGRYTASAQLGDVPCSANDAVTVAPHASVYVEISCHVR